MSKREELSEISRYLKIFGDRYKIAKENWVKLIIYSLMRRRSEILASLN